MNLQELLENKIGMPIVAFDAMLIAEEEIQKARQRHPAESERLFWRGFSLLNEAFYLYRTNEVLYRAHCQEILDRLASGGDTTQATDAELLFEMAKASGAVPLHPTPAALFERLFLSVFDGTPVAEQYKAQIEDANVLQEPHSGACDELLNEMRIKFARQWRVEKPHANEGLCNAFIQQSLL